MTTLGKGDGFDAALDAIDEGFVQPEKAKSGNFSLNQPGDFIKGVYCGSKPFTGKYKPTFIHTVMAESGEFHENDIGAKAKPIPGGDVTKLESGKEYGVFQHFSFEDEIAQASVGQRIVIRFVERKQSTQNKDAYYKVHVCKLDPSFVKPAADEPFKS